LNALRKSAWRDRKKEKEEKDRVEQERVLRELAEKEKQRAFELEKIRLEKEVEIQRKRSEHELTMAQMQDTNGEQDVEPVENGGQGDNHRVGSRSVAMKAMKLPPFNEDKDDLDAYLTRFERACAAFEVRPEHRSMQLARLLQGESLEVYQRLTDSSVEIYDVLKAQLLKRFRLTEKKH